MEDHESRSKRKEEGKRQKRQRIEESGGVRPRDSKDQGAKILEKPKEDFNGPSNNYSSKPRFISPREDRRPNKFSSGHRFGRVMEKVPCRNKPRFSTLSIALPGSVLSNCQTKELKTLLVGQIARAATIYHVDEIVVFDDKLSKTDHRNPYSGGWHRNKKHFNTGAEEGNDNENADKGEERERRPRSDPQEFMARVLQYCECPQYLRRQFFPMHPDLQFTGLLAPVDAPHHVRAEDRSKYREGVVLDKTSNDADGKSLVNCGIRSRPVQYVCFVFKSRFD